MQTLPQPSHPHSVRIDPEEEKPYQAVSRGTVHVRWVKRNSYIFRVIRSYSPVKEGNKNRDTNVCIQVQ